MEMVADDRDGQYSFRAWSSELVDIASHAVKFSLGRRDQIPNVSEVGDVSIAQKALSGVLPHLGSGGGVWNFICCPDNISPEGEGALAQEEMIQAERRLSKSRGAHLKGVVGLSLCLAACRAC